MLYPEDVAIGESALLVIDIQDSFKAGPRWARRNNPRFEEQVQTLTDAYREAGLPIYFFLHFDADPGFEPGNPLVRFMDFIQPRPEETVLHKFDTRNAFTATGLAGRLLAQSVRRVAICGIQMEQCCETTARVAADLGYAVDFVSEATLTFPIPHWTDSSRELGVEEIRERTEYVLARRFARISTVAMLADELKKGAAAFAAR
jgi:nicotinamidase-related amidase